MKCRLAILEQILIIIVIGCILRIAIILRTGLPVIWESLNPRY